MFLGKAPVLERSLVLQASENVSTSLPLFDRRVALADEQMENLQLRLRLRVN